MPYKKYYRSSRRYARRRGYNMPNYKTAARALQVALATKKLLNVEYKVHNQQITNSPTGAGLVSFMLSGLTQGDGTTSREGNSIKITSLQVRGEVTSTVAAQNVRYMIIKDTMNQGVSPGIAAILQNADPEGMYNVLSQPGRFQVLWDKTFDLSGTVGPTRKSFHWVYKGPDFHVKWNGSGGTNTDVRANAIYMIAIQSGSATDPTNNIRFRARFIDN